MAAGIHVVSKRLATGVKTHYVYAWRGGPLIHRSEGERKPPLVASIHDLAAEARRSKPQADAVLLRHLLDSWQVNSAYLGLSKDSRKTFHTWMPRIEEKFGDVPLAVFNDAKIRNDIVDWRDGWCKNPRTADHAVQTLRRILSFAVSKGLLDFNHAFRIPALYEKDRSMITWSKEDIAAFISNSSQPMVEALKLESCTGLRRTDLAEVTWDAVDDVSITWRTSKSRRKREVIIPLLKEIRELLSAIRHRHDSEMARLPPASRVPLPATILARPSWIPWTPDTLGSAFGKAMMEAEIDKHLHDMRGNFVTKLAIAGIPADQIAGIVGWSLESVREMLRRYVNKRKLVEAQAEMLDGVEIA